MASYPPKTPGVTVIEDSKLAPSVVSVATAIPAFIGHTEKTVNGESLKRISNLLEYEEAFGGPPLTEYDITVTTTGEGENMEVTGFTVDTERTLPDYLLYYTLQMYFNNGGGPCYIISVGSYEDAFAPANFEAGLNLLAKEDEPTLILLTDAVKLSAVDYHTTGQLALAQAANLGDRFVILDVQDTNISADTTAADRNAFRTGIGNNNLKYGAAYYPYLETTLVYAHQEASVYLLT